MNTPRYVAAIEVSSSKVIGTIGKIDSDGKLNIITTEEEKSVECVRYGIVQNVEETATRIRRILNLLERHSEISPRKVTGLYIGISGRSLRSIPTEVDIQLSSETIIDETIVKRLREKAITKAIDSSLEVIDAVPRSYTIGHTTTKDPIGNLGSSIKATFDLIVCRPQIKRNITRINLADRYNIHTHGFIVTPLAAGALIPTDSEKQLGCMLVDMGAETTTITIYKDSNLNYLATLPLGSRNITRDITKLNLLEESAEETKIQSGNALASSNTAELNIHGVDSAKISNIIVARCEEIVVNIIEQINYAGLKKDDIPGGIILIGGGSQLNNMAELIRSISNLQVRAGQLPASQITYSGRRPSVEAMEVISVLHAAATHSDAECLTMPKPENLPTYENVDDVTPETEPKEKKHQRKSSFFEGIGNRLKSILTPGEDDDDSDLM